MYDKSQIELEKYFLNSEVPIRGFVSDLSRYLIQMWHTQFSENNLPDGFVVSFLVEILSYTLVSLTNSFLDVSFNLLSSVKMCAIFVMSIRLIPIGSKEIGISRKFQQ